MVVAKVLRKVGLKESIGRWKRIINGNTMV